MSSVRQLNNKISIALLLALGMAATRMHVLGVPDASWAIFLLGGFYLRSSLLFGVFMAEAVLIDYLVTTFLGVSDWCITPAYLFLVPSYGALWLGGVWYARRHRLALPSVLPLAGAALCAISVAFLVSNASFYLLSGYFPEMSWTEYASRVAKYFPRSLSTAAAYLFAAVLVHLAVVHTRARVQRA